MSSQQTLYDTLGVARYAPPREITNAYRIRAMRWHPDRNKDPGAAARFRDINLAYRTLSDPERRRTYDARVAVEGSARSKQEDISAEEASVIFLEAMIELGRELAGAGYDAAYIHRALVEEGCPDPIAQAVARPRAGEHRKHVPTWSFASETETQPVAGGVVELPRIDRVKKAVWPLVAGTVALLLVAWIVMTPTKPSSAPARTTVASTTAPQPAVTPPLVEADPEYDRTIAAISARYPQLDYRSRQFNQVLYESFASRAKAYERKGMSRARAAAAAMTEMERETEPRYVLSRPAQRAAIPVEDLTSRSSCRTDADCPTGQTCDRRKVNDPWMCRPR
jgi:hypothetical protein